MSIVRELVQSKVRSAEARTSVEIADDEVEIQTYKEEESREQRVSRFLTRHLYQLRERFGEWTEDEPRRQLLERIQQRLYKHTGIPRGALIGLDAPTVNAFVVVGRPEVFAYAGLLHQLALWCDRHGKPLTEDKIAFVVAHELTHLEQHTEEEAGEKEDRASDLKQLRKNAEYDADRGGLILMANGGYNPKEGLETLEFLRSLGEGLPIFSSHPRSGDRLRELAELVNSPDTFLPSVSLVPTPVAAAAHDAILREGPPGRPGTRLYRRAGLEQLETLAQEATNLHDVLEIATVAFTHDISVEAYHAGQQEYSAIHLAQRIVLCNIASVVDAVQRGSFAASSVFEGNPLRVSGDKTTWYIQREFADVYEQLPDTSPAVKPPESFGQDIAESIARLKKKIKQCINNLEDSIANYQKQPSPVQLAPEDSKVTRNNLANDSAVLQKMKEIQAGFDGLMARVNAQTLDRIVSDVVSTDTGQDWAYSNQAKEYCKTTTATELLDLCLAGTIYFTDQSAGLPARLSQASAGAMSTQSFYEPYLPSEYHLPKNFSSITDRQQYIAAIRTQRERHVLDEITNGYVGSIFQAITEGSTISRIDPHPRARPFTDRISAVVETHLQQRYATLPRSTAEVLARFTLQHVFLLEQHGYDPTEIPALADTWTDEACQQIITALTKPVVEIAASANETFLAETGMAQRKGFELLLAFWEKQLVHAAQQRLHVHGHPLPEPAEQLDTIIRVLARSHNDAIDIYGQEIQTLLTQLPIQTCVDLRRQVSPLLNLIGDRFTRQSFLDGILKTLDGHVAPIELLRFLEGESADTIWKYFRGVWDTDRRAQLSTTDQQLLLKTVIELVPEWDIAVMPWGAQDRTQQAHSYYTELSSAYLTEAQQSDKELGFIDGLKFLLVHGYVSDDDSGVLLGNEVLETRWQALTLEQREELARYCVVIDGQQTKTVNLDDEWKRERPDQKIIRRLYNNILAEHNGIPLSNERALFNPEQIELRQNIQWISEFVPASFRNKVLIHCLQVYNLGGRYDKIIDDETFWPGGIARTFAPIPKSAYYLSTSRRSFVPQNPAESAQQYNPAAPDFTTIFKREDLRSGRAALLEGYVHWYTDRRNLIGDTTKTLAQRAEKLVDLVPEETDFRDVVFAEIETTGLAEYGWKIHGHALIADQTPITPERAAEFYTFYRYIIPLSVDQNQQQLWSRRADQLYRDYLASEPVTFSSEIERVCALYPQASFVRDEALWRLGDSTLIQTADQARVITGLLFQAQRRTTEEKTIEQQSQLERLNYLITLMDRTERKDLLLWLLAATDQPPLLLRAFGGNNTCSVESLPKLVFAATAQERNEFLTRLLQGENGVMDPQTANDQPTFTALIDGTFNRMFGAESTDVDEATRRVLRTIFTTVLQEYSLSRRVQIFLNMIEVARGLGETSTGERIRVLLESLGPVAIKAGQVLSEEEREPGVYVLPSDIRTQLKQLKQRAKTFHRTASFQVLEAVGEFNSDDPDRLVSLNRRLAAASIKQVYVGMTARGEEVLEKIRRPSIGKHLEEDLRVLKIVLDRLSESARLPAGLAERIGRWLHDEADFEQEVHNHQALDQVLQRYQQERVVSVMTIRVPQLGRHSTEHIREEVIHGLSLEELLVVAEDPTQLGRFLQEHGMGETERTAYTEMLGSLDTIRQQVFDALLYQNFKAGLFHSDPHAGNILITPTKEIVLIDVGSAGKIEPEKLTNAKQFFLGFLFSDAQLLATGLRAFVPGLRPEELEAVTSIVHSSSDNREKFNHILIAISGEGRTIDEGFEKFLKGLATGAYLTRGINPAQLAPSIMAYTQLY